MALLRKNKSEIPNDAVILSEYEAVRYQSNVLLKWKPQSDVWAIKYGGTSLAVLSAMSGMYLNNYFRNKYKLVHYGRMASYLPVTVIPSLFCLAAHTQFVLPSVVLQKECPVCIEMRASALQASLAVVFPSIIAPAASLTLAAHYYTFDVPAVHKEPMKLVTLLKQQFKPISRILFAMFIGHAVAASFITYLEAQSVERVHDKLMKMQYNMDHLSDNTL